MYNLPKFDFEKAATNLNKNLENPMISINFTIQHNTVPSLCCAQNTLGNVFYIMMT